MEEKKREEGAVAGTAKGAGKRRAMAASRSVYGGDGGGDEFKNKAGGK